MKDNYSMKYILIIFLSLVFIVFHVSCSSNTPNRTSKSYKTQSYFPEKWETQNLPEYHAEIVQFHHKDKCDTCIFLHNSIIDLLNTTFKAEGGKGIIIYHSIITGYAENLTLTQIFSVMEEDLCGSLYIKGEHTQIELWRDVFLLAEEEPESAKELLVERIKTLIEKIQKMEKTDED